MIKNSSNQKRNKNNKRLINIKDFQILFMPNKINLNSIDKNNNLKSIESSKNNTNILNNSTIKKNLYIENDIIKQTLQSRNNNKKSIFKRKKEIFNEFLADMRKIKKPPKFQLKYKSEQENEFIDYFKTTYPPKYKIERTNIIEYKIRK